MEIGKISKLVAIFFLLSFSFIIVAKSVSSAETYYCAERTKSGAWCQNVPLSQVDQSNGYRKAPSSCESTAFCKLGTCVNSNQGLCRPNVAQRVCQQSNGVWFDKKVDEVPQCRLGCCVAGEMASFVTETACKGIASQYGINTTFRSDVTDSLSCIALAGSSEKGACVIDDGLTRDCKVITRGECNALGPSTDNRQIRFNPEYLCTAETLATICAPTKKTTCVDGKFGVYFVDSCGNIANIYDASKAENKEYWTKIKKIGDSSVCGDGKSNIGSDTCGNCDYFLGSTCQQYQSNNKDATPNKPKLGEYVCADLGCKTGNLATKFKQKNGRFPQQGEEWCATDSTGTNNLPGSESYIVSCYNGEITATMCGTGFRTGICREELSDSSNSGFKVAGCVTNQYQDCNTIREKEDCLDIEKRDCKWIPGNDAVLKQIKEPGTRGINLTAGACVPNFAPGYEFWGDIVETTSSATSANSNNEDNIPLCSIASQVCVVKYSRTKADAALGKPWHCVENCQCVGLNHGDSRDKATLENAWVNGRLDICSSMGDCGSKKNYIGTQGYFNKSEAVTRRETK